MPRWMQKKINNNNVICSMYISSWVKFHSQYGIQAFVWVRVIFWQGTQSHDKAIQFSGLLPVFFLPKWLSISHRDHYCNVCQNMFKIWSCKNRNQVSFFEGSIKSSYILGSWRFQLNRFKVVFFFLQWKRQVPISWDSPDSLHQLLQSLLLITSEQPLPKILFLLQ